MPSYSMPVAWYCDDHNHARLPEVELGIWGFSDGFSAPNLGSSMYYTSPVGISGFFRSFVGLRRLRSHPFFQFNRRRGLGLFWNHKDVPHGFREVFSHDSSHTNLNVPPIWLRWKKKHRLNRLNPKIPFLIPQTKIPKKKKKNNLDDSPIFKKNKNI